MEDNTLIIMWKQSKALNARESRKYLWNNHTVWVVINQKIMAQQLLRFQPVQHAK